MNFIGKFIHWVIERGAANMTLQEIRAGLQKSSGVIAGRIQKAADTAANRKQACHIIGIELWGQHRLRTVLGEVLEMDEYDNYRPSADKTVTALAEEFRQARQKTLALVDELENAKISVTQTVPHNDLGDLTVRGWLRYIQTHAERESMDIR